MSRSTNGYDDDVRVSAALEAIRSLARREAEDHVVVRYGIGQVVFDLRSDGTYGDDVVKHLAKSIGLAPASLYRAAKVYEAYPSGEIELVRARFREADLELNFSTLIELSAVQDRLQREIALNQVLANRWSIRQLKASLKPKTAPTMPTSASAAPTVIAAAAADPTITALANATPAVISELGETGLAPAAAQALRDLRECVLSLERLLERASAWAAALRHAGEEHTPEASELVIRAYELMPVAYDQIAAIFDERTSGS